MVQASVVLVSRDRPQMLARTLKALTQQTIAGFDVVVVTNSPQAETAMTGAKFVSFDDANISAARNKGICAASGEIIAFCDDDSVPEPRWLERLLEPFAHPRVGAAGGDILGRNGVEVQWQPIMITCTGDETGGSLAAGIYPPEPGHAIKTHGTNCAFRRSAIETIGGFDEAFRYFLDEADVNWRLARAGWRTAIVHRAIVHHGLAESNLRTKSRVPKSYFEIGASKAVFLKKHCNGDPGPALVAFRNEISSRILSSFSLGLIEFAGVSRLRKSFEAGLAAGMARDFGKDAILVPRAGLQNECAPAEMTRVALCGGFLVGGKLRRVAADLANSGANVTVVCLSLTGLALTVRYQSEGYWLHTGGVYGRAARRASLWKYTRRRRRFAEEIARIADQRSFDFVAGSVWGRVSHDPKKIAGLEGFRNLLEPGGRSDETT